MKIVLYSRLRLRYPDYSPNFLNGDDSFLINFLMTTWQRNGSSGFLEYSNDVLTSAHHMNGGNGGNFFYSYQYLFSILLVEYLY